MGFAVQKVTLVVLGQVCVCVCALICGVFSLNAQNLRRMGGGQSKRR